VLFGHYKGFKVKFMVSRVAISKIWPHFLGPLFVCMGQLQWKKEGREWNPPPPPVLVFHLFTFFSTMALAIHLRPPLFNFGKCGCGESSPFLIPSSSSI
jgi:hypothetical protein